MGASWLSSARTASARLAIHVTSARFWRFLAYDCNHAIVPGLRIHDPPRPKGTGLHGRFSRHPGDHHQSRHIHEGRARVIVHRQAVAGKGAGKMNGKGETNMATVSIQEAQAKLSDLIHQLSPGEEVVITENSEPVAK